MDMELTKCCSTEIVGTQSSHELIRVDQDARPKLFFQFLALPLEIRMLIYEFVFSFDSIDNFLKKCFNFKLFDNNRRLPIPVKSCPSILLVNREIFKEAFPFLHATPLILSHGIMDIRLPMVIAQPLLRKLSHITISDAGCRAVDFLPGTAFTGLCYTVIQLCSILRPGHCLKSLTVDFNSSYVNCHLENCLERNIPCGINSWVRNLIRFLAELYSIKHVVLNVKIPEVIKDQTMRAMTSHPRGFFALPFRVRQKVYGFAIDYNEAIRAMRHATKALALNNRLSIPIKRTPTVLLVNKQMSEEATAVMLSKPLVISGLYPVIGQQQADLRDYISLDILRRVRHLEINLTDHSHLLIFSNLAAELEERQHKLESFLIHFSEPLVKRQFLQAGCYYPDNAVICYFDHLKRLRGITRHMEITGSLPDCYTGPLIRIMTVGSSTRLKVENILGHQVPAGSYAATRRIRHRI